MTDPSSHLARWQLTDPEPLKTEGHAHIWRVRQADGQPAALKLYLRDDFGNERNAPDWHRRFAPSGACPKLIAQEGRALLYDWVAGESLGDLYRTGAHDTADRALAEVMQRLHRQPISTHGPFVPLAHYTGALRDFVPPPSFTDKARADMAHAQAGLADLLASQPPEMIRLLHGDLHHDNVLGTPERWQVIDPKAVTGDLHFEPANAFRNPTGGRDTATEPARIIHRATLWSEALGLDRARLLHWAEVKCALSIAWTCGSHWDGVLPNYDLTVLPLLREIALAERSDAP